MNKINYNIFIWKQDKTYNIRPAFCCEWCKKLIYKNDLKNNIYTVHQCNTQCAIHKKIIIKPLIKCKLFK